MTTVTFLIGLPNSGKSTWISNNRPNFNGFIYSTDAWIESEAQKLGLTYNEYWSNSSMKLATRAMNDGLAKAIAKGEHVIWDQTNIYKNVRLKKLANFGPNYIKIGICFKLFSDADFDVVLERNRARKGKVIPVHVMETMRDNYELPTIFEGYNALIFYDIYGKKLV